MANVISVVECAFANERTGRKWRGSGGESLLEITFGDTNSGDLDFEIIWGSRPIKITRRFKKCRPQQLLAAWLSLAGNLELCINDRQEETWALREFLKCTKIES
jgi:hypothetical protein